MFDLVSGRAGRMHRSDSIGLGRRELAEAGIRLKWARDAWWADHVTPSSLRIGWPCDRPYRPSRDLNPILPAGRRMD